MNFAPILAIIFSLLIGITVHECAHAYVADKLGDPTARLKGRISLNPKRHLDFLGTLMMVISGLSGVGFGWGKPVPINPYNFKKPTRDEFLVAIAGPASNFAIAYILGFIIKLEIVDQGSFFQIFFLSAIQLNIGLMIFNLIPIPPLDGSSIIGILFPKTWANHRKKIEQYGSIILLLLIFMGKGLLFAIISPLFNFVMNIVL